MINNTSSCRKLTVQIKSSRLYGTRVVLSSDFVQFMFSQYIELEFLQHVEVAGESALETFANYYQRIFLECFQ